MQLADHVPMPSTNSASERGNKLIFADVGLEEAMSEHEFRGLRLQEFVVGEKTIHGLETSKEQGSIVKGKHRQET